MVARSVLIDQLKGDCVKTWRWQPDAMNGVPAKAGLV